MTTTPTTTAGRPDGAPAVRGAGRPDLAPARPRRRPSPTSRGPSGAARGSRRRPGRTWTVRAALVVGLSLLVLAFAPGSAPAGTYRVESCTNGSVAGWAPFAHGLWSTWGSAAGWPAGRCAPASRTMPAARPGGRSPRRRTPSSRGSGSRGATRCPRTSRTGRGRVHDHRAGPRGHYDWRPNYGGALTVGPESNAADGLRGEKTLTVRVDCGGGSSCTGDSTLQIHGGSIDLRDDAAPDARRGVRLAARCRRPQGHADDRVRGAGQGRRRADRRAARGRRGRGRPRRGLLVRAARPVSAVGVGDAGAGHHAAGRRRARGETRRRRRHARQPCAARPVHDHGRQPPGAGGDERAADLGRRHAARRRRQLDRREPDLRPPLAALRGRHVAGRGHRLGLHAGPDDAGHRLRFRVRASNAEGTGEAFSEPTARLPAAAAHAHPGADRHADGDACAGRGRRAAGTGRARGRPGRSREAERGVRRDRSPDGHAALG